ncbi:hypothetical protein OSB04_009952 [Centaurea solstitialis]|uniref:DUF659 domain-containing protein n=1 Tax=Centaurea solstitialis TaxID=347529 RepID=A0AA38TRF9_9ASTR|nr:hypothetical protein OSB04_009952 [Centaurea solstitialis]
MSENNFRDCYEVKATWKKTGVSLLLNGWSDEKNRSLINFLVNNQYGTVFLRTVDASDCVEDAQKLFKLLDAIIEEIGEDIVIQVVTDNESVYKAVGNLLMEKRKSLYWTPCVAHCIDLMLEKIGELPRPKNALLKAKRVSNFIHTSSMGVEFNKKVYKERSSPTRYYKIRYILFYSRKHQSLQMMFVSNEWVGCAWAKEPEGMAVKTIVMDERKFWPSVVYSIKITKPLMHVLRLVEGETPAMAFIYGAMDEAKEKIAKNLDGDLSSYKEIWDLIDSKWECQLHCDLHATAYYLNPRFRWSPNVSEHVEIKYGLYRCMERLIKDDTTFTKIDNQLNVYTRRQGLFGFRNALSSYQSRPPVIWWDNFGDETPELKAFAIRILGLTCSTSTCEHSWSLFNQMHIKRRSHLSTHKMNNLVYVTYNKKLRDRFLKKQSLKEEDDPLIVDEVPSDDEWIANRDDEEDSDNNGLPIEVDKGITRQVQAEQEPTAQVERGASVKENGKYILTFADSKSCDLLDLLHQSDLPLTPHEFRVIIILIMASSSGNSLPAPEAIQVLVSSLADDSPMVKQASMSSLKSLAPLNPLLVLDCCLTVSRGGRRRFGNIAGVFQVMSIAIGALEEGEVDTAYMTKLAKLATAEIISSKEIKADWQRAASSLLVAIGSHLPDLMMEELYIHLSAQSSALPAMIQILADFATSDALQFTPRLKGVLSRVLPILGNVRDQHRPIFANAFKCWCQACWQYSVEFPLSSILDSDVTSFLNSAFELLLQNWATSRDLKVRTSAVEALGQMVGLVTRTLLKAGLPKFVPIILELYRRDQDIAFLATCSLHSLLNASLLSESSSSLLDFEDLTVVLSTLLPVVCNYTDIKGSSEFSVGLKTYNEVQHCFLTVGMVYPEDLFIFLLQKCKLKEDHMTFGALCVIKHLLPRLSEAWHNRRSALIEAITVLLEEHNLGVCKALAELIVVMASHCYLVGPSGELFVEYLVRHCAMSDQEIDDLISSKDIFKPSYLYYSFQQKRSEVKIGSVRPTELRAICEKGLLLITITIPEMENVLWPFMLKMIIPRVYTGAVATVCRCISDMCRNRSLHNDRMIRECRTRVDIPRPEELFARLVVLLHNPLAREQLATQILTVLCYLASLFPKNINLFWQDEIPKMKAYVSDTEDLKQDHSYQETWDDMIINFLAETLDVVQDTDWVISLGNALAKQYELYTSDDEHSALLHRCLGILLQKVDNRTYVRDKIDWMYKRSNITIPENRLGLAKAMGLVAASHLDTVLDKLKEVLDNIGESILQRFLSFFSDKSKMKDSDDIHAAMALIYAPSTVIEARIDALVGTNMLSHLLIVRHPNAKQAVITAIDLLGRAVINAAESGISFPLKKRDQLLDYILTLMRRNDEEGFSDLSVELLHTQALALSACTTLVSVDPKLTNDMRNIVMKATLGFFALPNDPAGAVNPLIDNLITLMCAILLTSGEDGRSRAEQLLHILRQIDQYVSSPLDYQRKRGCHAVYEMLLKFRTLCITGYCALGCQGSCKHIKQVDRSSRFSVAKLPSAFVLPSRDALCLGERVIVYLPRCADTNSEVRKVSAQILCQFFDISLSLPRAVASNSTPIESSYTALSSLEDIIAILRRDTSIDPSEVFNRVISSVCILLTKDELVATLYDCSDAICDKIKPSAEGGIQAVIEFVTKRGNELNETDISRTAQSLLLAAVHVTEKYLRHETLVAISALAEHTNPGVVFSEVLTAAARDIVTKDILRMPGGWPMQDAFYAFSQHHELSSLFLEHLISALSSTSVHKADLGKGDPSGDSVGARTENDILQAAIVALTAFFRGGGKVGKRAVENSYASVTAILTLHLGSCYSQSFSGQQEQRRTLLIAFQAFCECVGDLEMGKILARDGEQNVNEVWINLIGDLAGCISIKRPKEISAISVILSKYLNQPVRFQREAAAAALSEYVRYSNEGSSSVLEEIVEALCRHVSDESPMVRRLCLRGLVQIPTIHINMYTKEILGVILALLDDSDDSVQLTAVLCLLSILEASPEGVEHVLLNLCVRLRNLQVSMDTKMRANSFAAFGALSDYGSGEQRDSFLEQVHAVLPRLILHLLDEEYSVRQACRNTLRRVAPLMEIEDLVLLLNTIVLYPITGVTIRNSLEISRGNSFSIWLPELLMLLGLLSRRMPFIYPAACFLDRCHHFSIFYQVFGLLVGKASRSTDAIVRATCSSALGMLLKSANLISWRVDRLDHTDSGRSSIDSESSSRSLESIDFHTEQKEYNGPKTNKIGFDARLLLKVRKSRFFSSAIRVYNIEKNETFVLKFFQLVLYNRKQKRNFKFIEFSKI